MTFDGINFAGMIRRVIKLPSKQLLPIPIRQPIPLPKRRPNIRRITWIRSLLLLLPPKNRPIHHRTIRHHLLHPRSSSEQRWPPRRQNSRQSQTLHQPRREIAAQTPALEFFRQSANHVQNVQVRRSRQKLAATLPRSAIPRIEHPISLRREKFSQRLFARNRRHPIAQDNRPLRFRSARRRQKLGKNVARIVF
jgi:hypothetical protein